MTDLAWTRPKLAELCGLKAWKVDPDFDVYRVVSSNTESGEQDWRPDDDVAQAVRCLEALHAESFRRIDYQGDVWTVVIYPVQGFLTSGEGQDRALPRAICCAIARSSGWAVT